MTNERGEGPDLPDYFSAEEKAQLQKVKDKALHGAEDEALLAEYDVSPNGELVDQRLREFLRQRKDTEESEDLKKLIEEAKKISSEAFDALSRDNGVYRIYKYFEDGVTLDPSRYDVARDVIRTDEEGNTIEQSNITSSVKKGDDGSFYYQELVFRNSYRRTFESLGRETDVSGIVTIKPDGNFSVRRVLRELTGELVEDYSYSTDAIVGGQPSDNGLGEKNALIWLRSINKVYTSTVPQEPSSI